MNFNKLYEDIFKPANKEEINQRIEKSILEKFKNWIIDKKYGLGLNNYNDVFEKENINKRDRFDITPLMKICGIILGYDELVGESLVEELLRKGANPNIKTGSGETSMNFANGNIRKLLLKYGARLNNLYEDIFKPVSPKEVEERKKQGDIELAEELLSKKYPLSYALHFGRYRTIKYLLDKGFNPNEKFDDNSGHDEYSIFQAVDRLIFFSNQPDIRKKWYVILKLLLDYKADPNIKDYIGYTPLYYLRRYGSKFMNEMELLKQHGAKE